MQQKIFKPVSIILLGCLVIFSRTALGQNCTDTSFVASLRTGHPFWLNDQKSLYSGNTAYAGSVKGVADTISGLLLMSSRQGDIRWARSLTSRYFSIISFRWVSELADGGLIVTGRAVYINRDANEHMEYPLIAKYDRAGNLLWHHVYKPAAFFTFPVNHNIKIDEVLEDENGAIYGTVQAVGSNYKPVISWDRDGNIRWSRSQEYRNSAGGYTRIVSQAPLQIKGDTLCLVGYRNHDFFISRYRKSDGTVLDSRRFLLPVLPDDRLQGGRFEEQGGFKVFPLRNGHHVSTCRIYGNFLEETFFLAELDGDLNLVRSAMVMIKNRHFSTGLSLHSLLDIFVDSAGYIFFAVPAELIMPVSTKLAVAQFSPDHELVFQKLVGAAPGSADWRPFTLTYEGSYISDASTAQQLYLNVQTADRQLLLAGYAPQLDSVSACLRVDTLSSVFSMRAAYAPPAPYTRDTNLRDVVVLFDQPYYTRNVSFTKENSCLLASNCEELSLTGDTDICLSTQPVQIVARKNGQCLKKINWQTDTAALDSARVINDTVLNLYFKKEWQGNVYARLEGCGLQDSFAVRVHKYFPASLLGRDTAFCKGDSVVLKTVTGELPHWWGDGTQADSLVVYEKGTYSLTKLRDDGCMDTDTMQVVSVYPPPENILPDEAIWCTGKKLLLMAAAPYPSYTWSTGESTRSIYVSNPGNYSLKVTDINNCAGADTVLVKESACINSIFFPTAFSPNSDGHNDTFKPLVTGELDYYSLQIYNRWGQLIFETKNTTTGWSGSYKAQGQQPEVFVWRTIYKFKGEQEKTVKGSVLLVR